MQHEEREIKRVSHKLSLPITSVRELWKCMKKDGASIEDLMGNVFMAEMDFSEDCLKANLTREETILLGIQYMQLKLAKVIEAADIVVKAMESAEEGLN